MKHSTVDEASQTYDFIIVGGGLAGLSTAYYLNQSKFKTAKILIIDQDTKQTNDKTWSFWENGQGDFDHLVHQQWKGIWFHGSNQFSAFLPIDSYRYKMIRSVDFYDYMHQQLSVNPNIVFLHTVVEQVTGKEPIGGIVKTQQGTFIAQKMVFDSTFRLPYTNWHYSQMLQHFKGWVIETNEDVFDIEKPTMFDFRIDQHNECRFVYVLPQSTRKALVEFTIFSDNLLEDTVYEQHLKAYIQEFLKIEKYQIHEVENGIIPMSDEPHVQIPFPYVIRIGTSGGYVKASTGYSFSRTQRKLKQLVAELEQVNGDFDTFDYQKESWFFPEYAATWKDYLDSVLLDVMLKKRHSAKDIFTRLFSKNKPSQILKFLDEDTRLEEDIAIMRTVPIIPFIISVVAVFFRKLWYYLR